jgi:hypothetical protein
MRGGYERAGRTSAKGRPGQQLRRVPITVLTALLALELTACSALQSSGAGGGGAASGVASSEENSPGQVPTPSDETPTPEAPQVTFPWKPGRPQLGMNVYWVDNQSDSVDVIRTKARRLADYVIMLDVNSISISFPFFTSGPEASSVYTASSTPSASRVGIVLDEFYRNGLRTTLRPLMNEKALLDVNRHAWRGSIEPTNRDDWFASYRQFLIPYLQVARDNHATTFVIGTELSSLEADDRWAAVVNRAKRDFGGEIAYAVNWDSYVRGPINMPVDQLGIDAYFKLEVGDDASIPMLVAGWNEWLDRRTSGPLSTLILSEVGAPAEGGAYRHPARWGHTDRPLNLDVQERWFTAACQVARQRRMAGLYWWKLDFHMDPAQADPLHDPHDSFVGRPAEYAIESCFSAWGSREA